MLRLTFVFGVGLGTKISSSLACSCAGAAASGALTAGSAFSSAFTSGLGSDLGSGLGSGFTSGAGLGSSLGLASGSGAALGFSGSGLGAGAFSSGAGAGWGAGLGTTGRLWASRSIFPSILGLLAGSVGICVTSGSAARWRCSVFWVSATGRTGVWVGRELLSVGKASLSRFTASSSMRELGFSSTSMPFVRRNSTILLSGRLRSRATLLIFVFAIYCCCLYF